MGRKKKKPSQRKADWAFEKKLVVVTLLLEITKNLLEIILKVLEHLEK